MASAAAWGIGLAAAVILITDASSGESDPKPVPTSINGGLSPGVETGVLNPEPLYNDPEAVGKDIALVGAVLKMGEAVTATCFTNPNVIGIVAESGNGFAAFYDLDSGENQIPNFDMEPAEQADLPSC